MSYTLDFIKAVSEHLEMQTEEVVAEWRRQAEQGDSSAAWLVKVWEEQGDPDE